MNSTEPKSGVKKRLNESVLRPGDIVLTTTHSPISKTIQIATHSDISHALVYAMDRSVIDATGEGVHARNTQRLFFEEGCSVYALRLRAGLADAQLNAVITYLRGHIGAQYSAKEAMQTVLGGASEWSRKQFCSRLVAQAFSSAGIMLVSDPNYCSPADLKMSPLLELLQSPTVEIRPEEEAFWEDRADTPQLMREAINVVLDGARKRNANIQTFDDLHEHLMLHPEQDEEFCRLLENADYLSIWEIEFQKNPWQYDLGIISSCPIGETSKYCWSVINNEQAGPNRFVINRGGYKVLSHNYGLRFFALMLDLYEKLAALHRCRIDVATAWLETNGRLEKQTMTHLMPHTSEWITALEEWDPIQAGIVRAHIEKTGRIDICSICGDSPANDYYFAKEYRAPGGVDTLRLCNDCVQIRRANGEPFLSL